ncbi:MAG: hypothetical protein ACRENE_25910 [Polyangiaceae bacterium]
MRRHLAVAAAGTIALVLIHGRASAEGTTVVATDRVDEGPNTTVVTTGLVTFGIAYGTAVIVAAQSSQDADHHLYVPIVGPWLDLGNRPSCGVGNVACDTETTSKVLITVDGVFQAVGAITTVFGLLDPTPRRRAAAKNAGLTLHMTPAPMGAGGYGLVAVGAY